MSLRPRICIALGLSLWLFVQVQWADALQGVSALPDPTSASHPQQSAQAPALAGAWASASDAVGLIRLDLTVHDEKGNPVSGLAATDFTLLENEKLNKILSFRAFDRVSKTSDAAVELILFLDTINLSNAQISVEEREVAKFLRQNGGHLAQPVSLFWLAPSGLWVTPQAQPSVDGNGLAAGLEHSGKLRPVWSTKSAESPENAGASIQFSLNFLSLRAFGLIAAEERQKPGRKLLVWIGPDLTMGTGTTKNLFGAVVWFSTLLREARISLYSLSVGQTEQRPVQYLQPPPSYEAYVRGVKEARQAMLIHLDRKVLALESGGRVMDPSLDLASQIKSCVADVGSWYVLTFDPEPADRPDEYHNLRVQVGKPGLTASTNTGFYDQPYYEDRPTIASKRVSVDQLTALLATTHGSSDKEMARQLSDMELTERLRSAKLISLEAELQGNKARQALVALADASAFLDPPVSEIAAEDPPDAAEQREMQSKVVAYLTKTIPKLPNFFATRTTMFYAETAANYEQAGEPGVGYQPLHMTEISKATLLVRDGKEVADSGSTKSRKPKPSDNNLTTYGTFGPILGTVILDAADGSGLTWSRWEQGADGRRATFSFTVPSEKSHYTVSTCCLPDGDGTVDFHKLVGYHGDITIDPETGTIFRLAVEADLKQIVPLIRSDVMVEYGPVRIGQKLYICPVRSVSIMRGRTIRLTRLWDAGYRTFAPFVTHLNDATFGEYHAFGAESRMLPGFSLDPEFAQVSVDAERLRCALKDRAPRSLNRQAAAGTGIYR
jgi:VWFA-related protein